MESHLNKKGHKWTNGILIIITLAIVLYVAYVKGFIPFGTTKLVELEVNKELLTLDIKEKSTIGVNEKQIYKVTNDGITSYNFEGEEIWSDTFSMSNFVIMQRKPYIAVGSKQGKHIILFSEKGRQAEIVTSNPIVYFSVNELGGIVTIENENNSYTVTAYDAFGKKLCWRTSFISTEGYPVAAELSPDNKLLLISYVSVDEPQVVSVIKAVDVEEREAEQQDNVKYGYKQTNNLVYDIEFISKDTWVSIGDKVIDWYDLEGNQKGTQSNLSAVFVPYLTKMTEHGLGYFPMILTEKPTQNIVHRQDEVAYFNDTGEKTFSLNLDGGVEYFYADEYGVTVQLGSVFSGYDKLGNPFFEYTATTDVSKVIYIPSLKKGIAVNKENVLLLTPKKEKN